MKKTIALLLTFLLLLPCFTSCSSANTKTVKTKTAGLKTKIEFSDHIANYKDDVLVLNLNATGDKEEYEKLTLKVEVVSSYGDTRNGVMISTPDADASEGAFSAEYEFDGELETSVIINLSGSPGVAYYGEKDYDVGLYRINISFLKNYNDIIYEETLYVSGEGNECFISESEFSAKYKAINNEFDMFDIFARKDGSKIEALWLLLIGKI